MNARAPLTQRRQRGIALAEAVTTACVIAVAMSVSLPSLKSTTARRHVEGVAAQLETDIQFMRSAATARNESLRMTFLDGGRCYVVHSGPANACRCDAEGVGRCEPGAAVLRAVSFEAGGPVRVASNVTSMLADATRGTITPTATIRVDGGDTWRLNVIVNIMGRVRACAAAAAMVGYAVC